MLHDLFKNGNSSKKFFIMLVAMFLLTAMTVSCAWSTGIASVLTTFVGGLTGLTGLYFGGNVLSKKWSDKEKSKNCGDNDDCEKRKKVATI